MKHLKPKGKYVIISSPSGGGKTTICKMIINTLPFIKRQITATTRPQRPGEKHGRDYYFLSQKKFDRLKRAREFIETAVVYGHWYGSPKKEAGRIIRNGDYCAMALDIQGAESVKRLFKKEAILIFVLPPSMKVLKERLVKRRTDSPETIKRRLMEAAQEIAKAKNFDYIVINNRLKDTIEKIKSVLIAERHRSDNFLNL